MVLLLFNQHCLSWHLCLYCGDSFLTPWLISWLKHVMSEGLGKVLGEAACSFVGRGREGLIGVGTGGMQGLINWVCGAAGLESTVVRLTASIHSACHWSVGLAKPSPLVTHSRRRGRFPRDLQRAVLHRHAPHSSSLQRAELPRIVRPQTRSVCAP